jgi:hypothetical protein
MIRDIGIQTEIILTLNSTLEKVGEMYGIAAN